MMSSNVQKVCSEALDNEHTDYNESSIVKNNDFNSPINALSIANRNMLTPGTHIKANEDKSTLQEEKIVIQDNNPSDESKINSSGLVKLPQQTSSHPSAPENSKNKRSGIDTVITNQISATDRTKIENRGAKQDQQGVTVIDSETINDYEINKEGNKSIDTEEIVDPYRNYPEQ